MQTLYVPKYNLHYRVNPRNPRELQWSRKPFGPATQWQHAMSFKNPIRALDLDDETKQGVVVLNDSTTYVGSGVRTWGRKFYPAGTRIYSLYAIGENNNNKERHMPKLKIRIHEAKDSRKNNKEQYYKWMDDSMTLTGMSDSSYAGGCIPDDDGNLNPYFAIYIDGEDNPVYDKSTLDDKFKQAKDYIRGVIPALNGYEITSDYFDFVLEEDINRSVIDIIIMPKDALWDEDIDDIKFLSNEAVSIIDKACYDGALSQETLQKKGLASRTAGM